MWGQICQINNNCLWFKYLCYCSMPPMLFREKTHGLHFSERRELNKLCKNIHCEQTVLQHWQWDDKWSSFVITAGKSPPPASDESLLNSVTRKAPEQNASEVKCKSEWRSSSPIHPQLGANETSETEGSSALISTNFTLPKISTFSDLQR